MRQQEDAYAELELRQAVFLSEQQSQPKTEVAEARDISPTAECCAAEAQSPLCAFFQDVSSKGPSSPEQQVQVQSPGVPTQE